MRTKEVAEICGVTEECIRQNASERFLIDILEQPYFLPKKELQDLQDYLAKVLKLDDDGDTLVSEYMYNLLKARDANIRRSIEKLGKRIEDAMCFEEEVSKRSSERSFVYLARCDSTPGIYKIGKSKGLAARESCLKCGNIYLKIVASVQLTSEREAYKLETYLHKLFVDKRVEREWFEISEEDIQLLVDLFGFQFAVEDSI